MVIYSAATHIGWRKENQDALWLNEKSLAQEEWDEVQGTEEREVLALVCDGIGGGFGGQGASFHARLGVEAAWQELKERGSLSTEELLRALSLDSGEDIKEALTERFSLPQELPERFLTQELPEALLLLYLASRAQEETRNYYRRAGGWGGTTMTLLLLRGARCHLLNIGDSPAFRYCRREGCVRELTFRQNLAGYHRRDGLPVEPGDSRCLMNLLGLTRGGRQKRPLEEAWLAECLLEDGDSLLLCSDGLEELPFTRPWQADFADKDEDELLLDYLAQALEQGREAGQLVRTAAEMDGADNCTAILLTYREDR